MFANLILLQSTKLQDDYPFSGLLSTLNEKRSNAYKKQLSTLHKILQQIDYSNNYILLFYLYKMKLGNHSYESIHKTRK